MVARMQDHERAAAATTDANSAKAPPASRVRRLLGAAKRFRRRMRATVMIGESGLFDRAVYLQNNPDVAASGADPLTHYIQVGGREGRDPHALFDSDWYLARNPDVAAAGENPLVHYLKTGASEGRDPHPSFDTDWYARRNPDVAAQGTNPLAHYVRFGMREGRAPHPDFGIDPASAASEIAEAIGEGHALQARAAVRSRDPAYQQWIRVHETLNEQDRDVFHQAIARLPRRPLISVLVSLDGVPSDLADRALRSLRDQLYGNWELCVGIGAATAKNTAHRARQHSVADARVRVLELDGPRENAFKALLRQTFGGYFTWIDGVDELAATALFWFAREIAKTPALDIAYSDEDRIDEAGERFEPYLKTDWNPALMLSQNAVARLCLLRRDLAERVGGFGAGPDDIREHDLVLRCADATAPEHIRHVPRILYHRGSPLHPTPSAAEAESRWTLGARVVQDSLDRQKIAATVTRAAVPDGYQVAYRLQATPKVSIIIPSTCKPELLQPCLNSLLGRSSYPDFEIIVAANEASLRVPRQKKFLDAMASDRRLRICRYPDCPFNYSWVNNLAVGEASGSVLCFMNDDLEVISVDWLERLVARIQLPRVAAAGAMLYYPDDTIQHAGVILGLGGVAAHPFVKLPRGSAGYFGRAALEQDLSCVTAACMVVRGEAFRAVGGFDENLAVSFNDVDLCLRLRNAGWRIIWTPAVEMYHHESATIGPHWSQRGEAFAAEIARVRQLWGMQIDDEPFYNPNLELNGVPYSLSHAPRVSKLPPS